MPLYRVCKGDAKKGCIFKAIVSLYPFCEEEFYFPHGFDTTLFRAESVKNR